MTPEQLLAVLLLLADLRGQLGQALAVNQQQTERIAALETQVAARPADDSAAQAHE